MRVRPPPSRKPCARAVRQALQRRTFADFLASSGVLPLAAAGDGAAGDAPFLRSASLDTSNATPSAAASAAAPAAGDGASGGLGVDADAGNGVPAADLSPAACEARACSNVGAVRGALAAAARASAAASSALNSAANSGYSRRCGVEAHA